jgi:uncharacterized protein (DUF2249 family)
MNTPAPLELDVRPLLAAGRPPLTVILNAVNRLAPGQPLRVLAPFEPAPLFALLGERGYTAESQQLADGTWSILFRPGAESPP